MAGMSGEIMFMVLGTLFSAGVTVFFARVRAVADELHFPATKAQAEMGFAVCALSTVILAIVTAVSAAVM